MIEYTLSLARRPELSGRRAVISVGQSARIRVGRSRLVGRITYVATEFGHVTVWVRVPVVDIPLPELD